MVSCRNNGVYVKPSSIEFTQEDEVIWRGIYENTCNTNINCIFTTDYESFPLSWLKDGMTRVCLHGTGKIVEIWKE